MNNITATPSVVRALAKDRLALAVFALTWISIPIVLVIASRQGPEQAEGSPVFFVPIGLMILFGWRTRAVAEGLGLSRLDAKTTTTILVAGLAIAIAAVVMGGYELWTAVN